MTNPLSPLRKLGELGQSPWLDYIRRSLVTSGELETLIERDGLKGITSNPAIFEKAIRGSHDYDEALGKLRSEGLSPSEIYERLAVEDIRAAADVFRSVYDETSAADGYVSFEVSPYLANDTERTLEEARRLWKAVDRPNLMIKVPGTEAGIPAIERLIAEGINVNVTLLFARPVYERVVEAYFRGLQARLETNQDLSRIASVASFFVSRIDAAVEALLRDKPEAARRALAGKVAIANAKLAYQTFKRSFDGERWRKLESKGAQKQRLLWASTSTKDPELPDTLYVEELIGPETVNTLPMATLDAYRDHGDPAPRLDKRVSLAKGTLAILEDAGISLDAITDELSEKGVRAFAEAFDNLLNALDARCRPGVKGEGPPARYSLPPALEEKVRETLDEWGASGKMRRLWEWDASLWTGKDEGEWLGWLSLTQASEERGEEFSELQSWVRSQGFQHAVVLGMGGSSLCPEVLRMTFGKIDGFPELLVLDSTDPAQIRAVEGRIDVGKTLFIVSSKSGTTLEPNAFAEYFIERVKERLGAGESGNRFLAITDPGSQLEDLALEERFARVYHGVPSVGGRYSALSNFGMVPAAVMGLDASEFLRRADVMAVATSSCVPIGSNPGAKLGAVLGLAASHGRDKLTLIASPGISGLGAWLEQLIAESTGKQGKGIIPVDGESLGPPSVYGGDRLFVYVRLGSQPDQAQDEAVDELEKAGQPVVRIPLTEIEDLGQEFFRWEIATAVAGAILGIHPFDQPDVEASKRATRTLTEAFERSGNLPSETPFFEEDGVALFGDEKNVSALGKRSSLAEYLRAHLERLIFGDYFALLAYIEKNTAHESALQSIRHEVRNKKRVATCLGFGPRFLHSTGQAYKGGPESGVFLQVTCDDAEDLPVPGHDYTFGVVKAAQARGDLSVLAERGRRALRVHLGPDVEGGLRRLEWALRKALS
jgi:transaldolase/glucose-6-phosphate isomerase